MDKQNFQEKPVRVFISYAREDFDIAHRLYGDLKEKGIAPWLDKEEILPGQKWKIEIRKAIKECNFFLALLSSNSISKKGYVQKELKIAFDVFDEFPTGESFIIPIRLDECEPVEERLQELHRADIFPSYDECFNQIMGVLKPATHKKNIKVDRNKFADYPYAEFDILIAEPNETWIELYLHLLGEAFRCDVASTYEEAITRLKYYKYKIICGEFFFPPTSMPNLLSYISSSSHHSKTPIVIITGGFLNVRAVFEKYPNVMDIVVKGSTSSFVPDLQEILSKLLEPN